MPRIARILCVLACALLDAHADEPLHLTYRVTVKDPDALLLGVTVTASLPVDAWEPGMSSARGHASSLTTTPTSLTYEVALGRMARAEEDPDVAMPIPGGALFNDGSVLWRPEDLDDDARISVHFITPKSHPVAAPWEPTRDGGFTLDGMQLNGGAYVVLGPHQVLPVKLKDNALSAAVVGAGYQASPGALARWVERSASMVAAFDGGKMPVPRTQLILFPSGGSKPGQFGTTMRWGLGSIVLFFGSKAADDAFGADWVAPHELFHLTNPYLRRRIPWFTEGFTTYYQDLLRARSGARPVDVMWADLLENFDDTCGSTHLQPLRGVARQLGITHQYGRVYWGGACAAFILDVALRESSHNARSLDDLYKQLRRQSITDGPLDEDALTAAFHAALPRDHWAHGWLDGVLDGRRALPLDALYERLGLTLQGDRAVITPGAPWGRITAGIMGQGAEPGSWADVPPPPKVR